MSNSGSLIGDFSLPSSIQSRSGSGSQIFSTEQITNFSLSDFKDGGIDYIKETFDFRSMWRSAASIASCWDLDCDLIDQANALKDVVVDVIATGNFDAVLDIVQSFLPERCRLDTFELDYCLGYAITSIAVSAAKGVAT